MTLLGSGILYLVQAGIGAVVATTSASTVLSTIHLLLGMLVFAGIVVALAWTLEIQTGDSAGTSALTSTSLTDPESPSTADHAESMPAGRVTHAKQTAIAYIRLMKPRLMWLLCLVAFAAMALAGTTGPSLSWDVVLATLGGGVLSIGASGTFNNILERDIDPSRRVSSLRNRIALNLTDRHGPITADSSGPR